MYAEMHNHTDFSPLDGETTCHEAARRAVANGSNALAITDHGSCSGHVQFQHECDQAGIKPVFGIETYFQPDRLIRPAEGDAGVQKSLRSGSHLILLALGDRGLRDMWGASTEAFTTGFYYKPRMDWDLLEERGGDLIATTACLGGIISQDLLNGRHAAARATLDRMSSLFRGRLYLEVQPNELPDQVRLNRMLAVISEAYGLPLVAACDAHYPAEEDADLHRQWMLCQSGGGKDDYWHFSAMLPEDRVRAGLAYLGPAAVEQAIRSTTEIADRCTARIGGYADPPVFTPGGTADDDARQLRAMCERRLRFDGAPADRWDRMEYEFGVVAGKKLAGCYLIVEDIVRYVRQQGGLVGPGRGSAAGSLMSYLLEITSVDPLRAGLMFERFLTPGRMSLPDFDLDFPTSLRPMVQDYAVRRYGADHVVRVGTALRYQAKGILKKLFSAVGVPARLADDVTADAADISRLIDDAEAGTAGLGLPWDEIMQDPEMASYAEKYPGVFASAARLHGRVHAYGQHPAGLIISPQVPVRGVLPMRTAKPGDPLLVSQWDYRAADELNLLKLDFLTLRTLDSLQRAINLVAERTGIRHDPRSWDAEFGDPQVYEQVSAGDTLGIFQVETRLCTDYAVRMQPSSLADLADLTTFIRPGPRNSGATEKYLRRRAALEDVDYPHPLLEDQLRGSYGVMLYQEDILRAVRALGGYDDLEADGVRKILGKKQMDKIEAAGEEFTRRCTERGHDEDQIRKLWDSIFEFGRYAFNKSHGYSYGVLSYWTAWFTVHYPVEMTTAILSTLDDMDRMGEFATDARRKGISVLPPDVRFCGADFTPGPLSVRYGLSAIPKVGPAAIAKITAGQPYSDLEDFRARSGVNAGVLAALAAGGALDPLVPSRRGLVMTLEAQRDGSAVRCVHKEDDPLVSGPNGLPCTYDWASEPGTEVFRGRGKARQLVVEQKEPPRRCTVACRRYAPPRLPGADGYGEYSPDALFRQDWEIYGTWMSDASFARLDERSPGLRDRARQMALALITAPEGAYPLGAVLSGQHRTMTRRGSAMWWASLVTEVSVLRVACFSPRRDSDPDVPAMLRRIRPGTLVSAEVVKRGYRSQGGSYRTGWRLDGIWPVGE